ncbi:MAG TPA: glycerophosphodiester phosphodiesterase family protein [Elusimicrobiales bacterium]|nr:glycerophosphodiester phosphodiesterase family protein [Elusimicrobiales bacterium]
MKIIAHRGASADLPENTIASFLLAKKCGFTDFETDVQLTKDKVLVACHDYTLKRTAGADVKISELSLSELKKFNVAAYFRKTCEKMSVPSLEEVFNCLGNEAKIYLEIKNKDNVYPDICVKLLEFIKNKNLPTDNICLSSFHYPTLVKIRDLNPDIKIGVLARYGQIDNLIEQSLEIKAAGINVYFKDATAELINKAHSKALKVLAYTINEKEIAQKLRSLKIDGIFTDRVDLGFI